MIAGQLVAIDGSKIQSVVSNRKHMTPKKLKYQEAALRVLQVKRPISRPAKG